jgi:nucleoside-triphosphatase THEP1
MKLAYIYLSDRGSTDILIAQAVDRLRNAGVRLAGTVQTNPEREGRALCDMNLQVLPDGPNLLISQDLGKDACGCRLDLAALESAVVQVAQQLDGAELVVINKFGSHEAAGRGFVGVIADALERDIPVLVGVSSRALEAFNRFSEGLGEELPATLAGIEAWTATLGLGESV